MKRNLKKYILDADLVVREATRNVAGMVLRAFFFFVITVSLTIALYGLFALIFNTDTEASIARENKAYVEILPELEQRAELLEDVITELQLLDHDMYREIFHAEAPNVDPMSTLEFLFAADTIPDTRLTSYGRIKSDALMEKSASIERNFAAIFRTLAGRDYVLPPMTLPLKDINYIQVGAGKGSKFNPFYKIYVEHNGLDVLVPRGTAVYAAGDGVVTEVERSGKGLGNVVVITHEGGYETRYALLANIQVKKGAGVKMGQRIGSVGTSSNSYAPHLHYEILKDGRNLNPVHFLFASFGAEEYANVLYMSANTEQSMD